MAVSSLKGCWSKLSARIRDYIDSVDSHLNAADGIEALAAAGDHHLAVDATRTARTSHRPLTYHHNHHRHSCNRKSTTPLPPLPPPPAPVTTNPNSRTNTIRHTKSNGSHHNERPIDQAATLRLASLHQQQATSNSQTIAASNQPNSRTLPHYTKRKTAQGQVYFVDSCGHRYWHDPSVPKELLNAPLNLDLLVGKLSHNWEVSQTSSGKTYYINHIKKTTQFTDPRLIAYKDALSNYLRHNSQHGQQRQQEPQYEQHQSDQQQQLSDAGLGKELLCDKISLLRQELLKQQVLSHPCRIYVGRKRVFEESFRAISQMQPRDLKKRLLVKFRGEEGLDYGGVAREWFYLLSRELLNPVHGLFQYTSDDNYNLQINPDSGIVYNKHLAYMNFCGRVIGMAVFHSHFIEGHFTLPFYKMLLRKPVSLCDIEQVDPELYRSLCWMLENDITNIIDTTFLVHHNAFGRLQEHELKEGGRNISVTEENKEEYVSLYVNYRCRRGIENQSEALLRGFYELISPNLLENFDEQELELLIGGLSKINIDDWRLHTKLKNCTVETPIVCWFWDIVKSYNEDKRARLLQFVTGSTRVPIQGFKALQGVNSEIRLFTIHIIKSASTDNLPKAHTCFNRIDLPLYENYDKLRDKLTQAIEETMGFAMQ